MVMRTPLVLLVLAGCAAEAPSLDAWRGQYQVESSTCAFIDGTTPLRLHELERGTMALYTFQAPDAWAPVDNVTLEADEGGGLSGSNVTLLCGPPCSSCAREIRYAHDQVQRRTSSAIVVELARASQDPTDANCTDDQAWALAASAVTCSVEATYYAPDRI
jgi:hypothetical protein